MLAATILLGLCCENMNYEKNYGGQTAEVKCLRNGKVSGMIDKPKSQHARTKLSIVRFQVLIAANIKMTFSWM
jgi:hypothetical protein